MIADMLLAAVSVDADKSCLWERQNPFLINQAVLLQLATLSIFFSRFLQQE